MIRSASATGLLALAMLLTACGSAATPSRTTPSSAAGTGAGGTAPAMPEACDLFRLKDAVPALNGQGHDVRGPDQDMGGLDNCMWGDDTVHTTVQLSVFDAATFEKNRTGGGSGVTISPVTGIGDDAFFKSSHALGTLLFVRKGDLAFEVYIHAPQFSADQIRSNERAAAETVAGRL